MQLPSLSSRRHLQLQGGTLTCINEDDAPKHAELLFLIDAAACNLKEGGHLAACVAEDENDAADPYRLSFLHFTDLDSLGDPASHDHVVRSAPAFLTAEHQCHVVVSTKSGLGKAPSCWEKVVKPLLDLFDGTQVAIAEHLPVTATNESSGAPGNTSWNYKVLVTQTAHSVKDFARERWAARGRNSTKDKETIILLSGDGGVVDLLNGSKDELVAPRLGGTSPAQEEGLPTIALLPMGTGNALFHSLHRPLYSTKAATEGHEGKPPSSLTLGLRTLFLGKPAPLPIFRADFSPGSKLVKYSTGATEGADEAPDDAGSLQRRDEDVSHLFGAIVASYGFHAQLVWESDTPEYRKHGDKRFQMVAAELLRESHVYDTRVEVRQVPGDSGEPNGAAMKGLTPRAWHPPPAENAQGEQEAGSPPRDGKKFSYVLATMLSNLEKTFTISPENKPLGDTLRLVHFGDVGGERTMEIMMAAYDGGKHVGMEGVGYDEVQGFRVQTAEEDARWRKVCVDGTIVEIPGGGSMTVGKVEGALFDILVDPSVA